MIMRHTALALLQLGVTLAAPAGVVAGDLGRYHKNGITAVRGLNEADMGDEVFLRSMGGGGDVPQSIQDANFERRQARRNKKKSKKNTEPTVTAYPTWSPTITPVPTITAFPTAQMMGPPSSSGSGGGSQPETVPTPVVFTPQPVPAPIVTTVPIHTFQPTEPTASPVTTFAPVDPSPAPSDTPVTTPPVPRTTDVPTRAPVEPTDAPVTPAPVPAPTEAPVTPAPVVAPTDAPVTPAPVVAPTDAPVTPAPVVAPTDSPVTPAPVVAPTDSPVTAAPVVPPTVAPVTAAPVVPPTNSPVTAAPVVATLAPVVVSDLTLACDALNAGEVYQTDKHLNVSYYYELVTNPAEFEVENVVASLETAVALTLGNNLVPCESLRRELRRKLFPLGVDANDGLVQGQNCTKLLTNLTTDGEEEECFPMLGTITMYVSEDSTITQEEAQNVIFGMLYFAFNGEESRRRRQLQSGKMLVDPDAGILDLYFVGGVLSTDDTTDTAQGPGTTPPPRSTAMVGGRALGGLGIGVIVAACAGVVLVAVLALRKRRTFLSEEDAKRHVELVDTDSMESVLRPSYDGDGSYDMSSNLPRTPPGQEVVYTRSILPAQILETSHASSQDTSAVLNSSALDRSHEKFFSNSIDLERVPTFMSPDGDVIVGNVLDGEYRIPSPLLPAPSTSPSAYSEESRNYSVANTIDL